MQKRNFPNWIDAYLAYAKDGFVPEQFNLWSALSVVAGSLERRVWLPWSDTFAYYPNIFVLLVSLPGAGKSTALNKAMDIFQEMNERNGNAVNILPSQVTEAKFIEMMGNAIPFEYGTKIINQSAGFYWASEASNSLKNIYGDFISCLTDFYDCPNKWEKATKKDDKVTLRNVCLNLFAGSTFDYLGKLVTDDNIMGGFASRLIYVVHREKLVRAQKFQLGGTGSDPSGARAGYRNALIQDLSQIYKMVGPFSASKEFGQAWEQWYPKYEEERQSNPSEKMQSLLVRTNTNVLKVAMLFSAARSDERVLRLEDWDAAMTVVEPIGAEIPNIFREAKSSDTKSQDGLNQAIFKELLRSGEVLLPDLKTKLMFAGFDPRSIENCLKMMEANGAFKQSSVSAAGIKVKLVGNPNHHL